ncbi:hypothetical protein ABW20_dc0109724 [Dactylellina cionopaga]|nr:hypothetical protein ABW20_dc0109724 [Dactylellina cionopaga]
MGLAAIERSVDTRQEQLRARMLRVAEEKGSLRHDPEVIGKITELRSRGYNGADMLTELEEEHPTISSRQLKRIRHEEGIFLRSQVGGEALNQAVIKQLVEDQLEEGNLGSKGSKYSTTYLKRLKPEILVTGHAVREALREKDPVGVELRRQAKHRKRGEYRVAGPNAVWSADGYNKLAHFGFQIYGIIDAYSRRIIHVFVGITNRTMIAAAAYYLIAVKDLGFIPVLLRTDKGGETLMMAECQVSLRRAAAGENLPVGKCHHFGTSTRNTKIESWWGRLSHSTTLDFRELFQSYQDESSFGGSRLRRNAQQPQDLQSAQAGALSCHWQAKSALQRPPSGQDLKIEADKKLLDDMLDDILSKWNPDEYLHEEAIKACQWILGTHRYPFEPGPWGQLSDLEIPKGGKEWLWGKAKLQEGRTELLDSIEAAEPQDHEPQDLLERLFDQDMQYDKADDVLDMLQELLDETGSIENNEK